MGRIRTLNGSDADKSTKLNRLGKIKIGMKAKNAAGAEYPTSLDYFVATGKYAEKFNQAYPDKPTSVSIIFVSDIFEDSCNEEYQLRDNKGALVGHGDGIDFHLWEDGKNGEPGTYKPYKIKVEEDKDHLKKFASKFNTQKYKAKWYPMLKLQFVIPKINEIFGVWVFETKAEASSIPNIRDTFDNIKNWAGTVINIPFDLIVQKVKSQKPGENKTYSVVNLIPNISKDKMDDVRGFLSMGNTVLDIKKFLQESDTKALPAAKIDEEKKVKSEAQKLISNAKPGTLF